MSSVLAFRVYRPGHTIGRVESLSDAVVLAHHQGAGTKIFEYYLGANGRVICTLQEGETHKQIWDRCIDRRREITAELEN